MYALGKLSPQDLIAENVTGNNDVSFETTMAITRKRARPHHLSSYVAKAAGKA